MLSMTVFSQLMLLLSMVMAYTSARLMHVYRLKVYNHTYTYTSWNVDLLTVWHSDSALHPHTEGYINLCVCSADAI